MRINRRKIMRILHAGLAEEFVFRRNLPDQIKSDEQYLITCLIRQMNIPERIPLKRDEICKPLIDAMNTAIMRRNINTAE